MKRDIATVFILTGFLLITTQCATSPDPEPPLQTRILEVQVEPNPVAIGDTATFTCIIEDSLDERFKFEWGIDDVIGDTVTENNSIEWIAPNDPSEYLHTVRANNGSIDSIAPGKSFTITVTE